MGSVHPALQSMAAHYDVVGKKLGHEIRHPEFPGVQVDIALLKPNAPRNACTPRRKERQQTAPGQMSFDQIRPQLREEHLQFPAGVQKTALGEMRPKVKDVDWYTKAAELGAHFTVPE